jgi:hypothetical protein
VTSLSVQCLFIDVTDTATAPPGDGGGDDAAEGSVGGMARQLAQQVAVGESVIKC